MKSKCDRVLGNSIARILAIIVISALGSPSHAAVITWSVDSAQSFVRWSIPDQTIPGLGTVRVRSQTGTDTPWTDAGRRTQISGTLLTDLTLGSSITFLSSNMYGVEGGSFRPNPDDFNPLNINPSNPYGQFSSAATLAPAAIAGKFRGAVGALAVDVGYFSVHDETYAMSSPEIAISGQNFVFPLSSVTFNSTGLVSYDGLVAPIIGQPLPDFSELSMTVFGGELQSTGVGTYLGLDLNGSPMYRLNINLNLQVPILTDAGFPFVGTVTGVIIANGVVVPEVSALAMSVIGAAGLIAFGLHRRRWDTTKLHT